MKTGITPKLICRLFISASAMFLLAFSLGEGWPARIGAAVLGAVLAYILPAARSMKKRKLVNRSYDMDLPDMMTHISMFTHAGLSIWDAIERSAEVGDERRPLYRDILGAYERVRKGAAKDIMSAFEDLSASRESASLSNFCAAVIQNVRKGGSELSAIFAAQAQIYRNERRRTAGKIAEEAVTLLMIPSTIVLIALVLLLLAPAVMEMFGKI